jgi:hypothetical protein
MKMESKQYVEVTCLSNAGEDVCGSTGLRSLKDFKLNFGGREMLLYLTCSCLRLVPTPCDISAMYLTLSTFVTLTAKTGTEIFPFYPQVPCSDPGIEEFLKY